MTSVSDGLVCVVRLAQISHPPGSMDQRHASLRTLQAQRKTLEARAATYSTLATKLATFQTTLAISVLDDTGDVTTALQNVVDAYNDLIAFSEEQNLAASRGEGASIARDPVLRGLRSALRERLRAEYSIRGEYKSVAAIGLEFDRSGRLSFTPVAVRDALQDGGTDGTALLVAQGLPPVLFPALGEVLAIYTDADGLLEGLKARLVQRAHVLANQIAALQE